MYKEEMNQPLISIVIPVYNVEKYLKYCIDSILVQLYNNWELLLIDDGSTDLSKDICDQYSQKDHRIKVIHKKNGGVSTARNLGIKYATGDFITFIDSDDYVSPEYLSDFIRCHPIEKSIVVSGLITKTSQEEYISFQYEDISFSSKAPKASKFIAHYDLFKDGGPCNKLLDLKLIRENNLQFDTNISYHEDHIFIYSYYLHIDYIILSHFCGYYYNHYEDMSRKSLSEEGKYQCKQLFDASDLFLQIVPKLFSKYSINDELYKAIVVTRTGYSQRVLALYNLYFRSATPLSECRTILMREHRFIKQIRKIYYPISVQRKTFLYLLSLPISISHFLFSIIRLLKK